MTDNLKPTPYEAGAFNYGDRIKTVKMFRARTNLGLKDAMEALRAAPKPLRKDWERMDKEWW